MAKATTANKDYSTALREHQADKTLDRSVTGDDAVFMKDATNEAVRRYDPQPHDESNLPVLTEENPNLDHNPALAKAGNT